MQVPYKEIIIIGAGAMGKALAVFLQRADRKVLLVSRRIEGAQRYQERITVQLPGGEMVQQTLELSGWPGIRIVAGTLVVVTIKSFGNAVLAKYLKQQARQVPVVFLQNGLGVEEAFLASGFSALYRGVLFATSQTNSQGYTMFRLVSESLIGKVKGTDQELVQICAALSQPAFPFKVVQNPEPLIWQKTIINSVFNTLCPLLETDNGIFYRSAAALELAGELIREGVRIAALNGFQLDEAEIKQKLIEISTLAGGQLISTYQDILAGRDTEIATLNLAIAGVAERYHHPEMAVRNNFLGQMVRLKAEIKKANTKGLDEKPDGRKF